MNPKIVVIAALMLLVGNAIMAQSDIGKTENAEIIITPVFHGSLVIQSGGEVIYIDPYGDLALYENLPAPTIICISHPHGDHMNRGLLEKLDIGNANFVWPMVVKEQIDDLAKQAYFTLNNDESVSIRDISITAVPMYNLPNDESARHRKGWGNGYVLTVSGKRIYISGDTEDIPEMRQLQNIDFAFVCMNQPYTMTVDQAASAVIDFKPAIVYPYHFRGAGGVKSDVVEFKRQIEASGIATEVRIRNWYPE